MTPALTDRERRLLKLAPRGYCRACKKHVLVVDDKLQCCHREFQITKKPMNLIDHLPERFTAKDAIEIGRDNGLSEQAVRNRIGELCKRGLLMRESRGRYRKSIRGRCAAGDSHPRDWVKRGDELCRVYGTVDGLHKLMLEWTGGKLVGTEMPSRDPVKLRFGKTKRA